MFDETSGDFHVFLSTLAAHSSNLRRCAHASVVLLEERQRRQQAFVRKRVTYQCEATAITRLSAECEYALARFRERFGDIVRVLEELPDFDLFRLRPTRGQFIHGFGQAYAVTGDKLEHLTPLGPVP